MTTNDWSALLIWICWGIAFVGLVTLACAFGYMLYISFWGQDTHQ